MSYSHFRYARRVDADAIEIKSPSNERILHLDKTSGTESVISGQNTTADNLKIKANTIDDYPYINMYGNNEAQIRLKTGYALKIYEETTMGFMFRGSGALHLFETTTPTAVTNYGAIYTKNDNELYFQDGAGNEKTVTTV